MLLAAFFVVGLLVLQEIAADFASIKPGTSTVNYDYVAVNWLTDSVALAVGYSATGGVIIRSTTQGKSWTQVGTSIKFSGLFSIFSRNISSTWYSIAVDDTGMTYRSADSGATWSSMSTTNNILVGCSIGTNGYVFVSGIGYVGYNNSVLRTSPTWTSTIPFNMDSLYFYDIR